VTDNILIQPLIFSKSVKAHPLEIFVVIFVGAKIGGVLGMIFSIPVYTIFRVSFIEFFKGFKSYRIFKIKTTN
jgi:predicted PurR-regulated permease PerM